MRAVAISEPENQSNLEMNALWNHFVFPVIGTAKRAFIFKLSRDGDATEREGSGQPQQARHHRTPDRCTLPGSGGEQPRRRAARAATWDGISPAWMSPPPPSATHQNSSIAGAWALPAPPCAACSDAMT
jgi:hypothetical protein